MRLRSFIPVVFVLAAAVAGCGNGALTATNYGKLKVGMAYSEVKDMFGAPASCQDFVGIKNCTWGDEKRYVKVGFVNDQVVLFSGENLK